MLVICICSYIPDEITCVKFNTIYCLWDMYEYKGGVYVSARVFSKISFEC